MRYKIGYMFQNHIGGNQFIRETIREASNANDAKDELVRELEQLGKIVVDVWINGEVKNETS